MFLINRCAISRKELKTSDDVVSFPFYDAKPGEPEFICCEDIALRSEFERWPLRDSVTKKVRDFWIQIHRESKYILILAENENFLITKSTVEKRVRLVFLNHVFHVNFTWDTWEQFADLILTTEQGDISSIGEDIFDWRVDDANNHVILQTRI